jgi:hypothetical protein
MLNIHMGIRKTMRNILSGIMDAKATFLEEYLILMR